MPDETGTEGMRRLRLFPSPLRGGCRAKRGEWGYLNGLDFKMRGSAAVATPPGPSGHPPLKGEGKP